MKTFKEFQEGAGLWANIHKKRKEGRPMRKKGAKGAPTKQDIERSRSESKIDEAPLVMDDMAMLKTFFRVIEDKVSVLKRKKQDEKVFPILQQLASMTGYGITKSGQSKGRSFRYDLRKKK